MTAPFLCVEWIFYYVFYSATLDKKMKRLILFENKNLLSGQQEYSQRQAGIASGIVLAVLVPLVLLLVYIAYKFFERKQKEKDEEEEEAMNFEAQKRYGKILIVNKNMFQNYTMDIN